MIFSDLEIGEIFCTGVFDMNIKIDGSGLPRNPNACSYIYNRTYTFSPTDEVLFLGSGTAYYNGRF